MHLWIACLPAGRSCAFSYQDTKKCCPSFWEGVVFDHGSRTLQAPHASLVYKCLLPSILFASSWSKAWDARSFCRATHLSRHWQSVQCQETGQENWVMPKLQQMTRQSKESLTWLPWAQLPYAFNPQLVDLPGVTTANTTHSWSFCGFTKDKCHSRLL